MLFNSLEFLIFFTIVYSLYLVCNHQWQNRMLLVASYVFYGCWDWRFLSLIFVSTLLDYVCGLRMASRPKDKRKIFLWISLGVNLTLLGFFKYFNFFTANVIDFLALINVDTNITLLNIILPVGISFYTFQSLSYTIDIYRGEIKPTRNFIDFALYVALFTQLVAGPIERAKHLLPQVIKPRTTSMTHFYEGCFLIFWGLFEKIFIAGNLAKIVDPIFAAEGSYEGLSVLVGMYAFSFQIFCDFDAYSNIAKGLGRCMGFDIMTNFNLPFFVTNMQDFWNRWHISLSLWIRDYLYFPLFQALKKFKGNIRVYITLLISMTLIGLWHGASWNFVVFGVYHGILLAIYVMIRLYCQTWVNPKSQLMKGVWHVARVVFAFHLIAVGMLIFRVQTMGQAARMLGSLITNLQCDQTVINSFVLFLLIITPLLVVQFGQLKTKNLMFLYNQHWLVKTFAYAFMSYLLLGWGIMQTEEFIYFQF